MNTKIPVIIFGAKGLGKVALEIFKSNDVVVYGFLEDDKALHGTEIDFVQVLGDTDDDGFLKLIGQKCDAFIASEEMKYRQSLTKMLNERRKVMPINAIHPTSYIASTAQFGYGNLFNMGVKIGADVKIENHCLLHTGVQIDYETKIENFVQIGIGSNIGAGVIIEEGVFIGAGVTIVAGLTIGRNARVGAGSVVVESVKAKETVFGNPAVKVG